jgi:hypothetical protein
VSAEAKTDPNWMGIPGSRPVLQTTYRPDIAPHRDGSPCDLYCKVHMSLRMIRGFEEVDRLTLVLHEKQQHPDFEYCMTFDNLIHCVDKKFDGWEPNPALEDAHHGTPGGAQYRQPHESRQIYWMRRKP